MSKPDDYLKLPEYPLAIKEIGDALTKVRHQLRQIDDDLKYRAAWLRRYGGVDGSNEKQRDAALLELLRKDPDHKGLVMRNDELELLKNKLEVDAAYLRDQFTVIKLTLQERIAFAKDTQLDDVLTGLAVPV